MVDEFLELGKDFFAYGNVDRRLVLIVVGKQVRIPGEQELQTQLMTVLRAKMARSVSVDIFGVYFGSVLNESLYQTQVASKTRNMKWCSKVICSGVNL